MRFHRLPLVLLFASSVSLTAAQGGSPAEGKSSGGIWHSFVGGLKTVADGAGAVAKTAVGAVGRVFDFSGPKSLLDSASIWFVQPIRSASRKAVRLS
jgi:hypothetical protein